MTDALGRLMELPRLELAHKPTPIEYMKNLSVSLEGTDLYVKREDCTGLAFGGNKVRQLEFYLGEAASLRADTVLITGAIQSNFVRLTAAAAARHGLKCHVQLEERVAGVDDTYRNSGNVLLDRLFGAHIHYYDQGEDEAGADHRLGEIAESLRAQGSRPYIIPLAPGHAPLGALGYVLAARELMRQMDTAGARFDEMVVASGSGHTHAGLLFGLRALDCKARVTGICVRREATAQHKRIKGHLSEIAGLLGIESRADDADIHLSDDFLAPGYGATNPPTMEAIELAARLEGLVVDPTYTAKAMAGLISRARQNGTKRAVGGAGMLFIHTGGQPAIFGYEPMLTRHLLA